MGNAWLDAVAIAAGITALLVCLEAIRRVIIKPVVAGARKFMWFLDFVVGEPAHDGHAAVPPLPERLLTMHKQLDELLSMRSQMTTIDERTKRTEEQVADIDARTKRTEWHVGNGNPHPLRKVVEAAVHTSTRALVIAEITRQAVAPDVEVPDEILAGLEEELDHPKKKGGG